MKEKIQRRNNLEKLARKQELKCEISELRKGEKRKQLKMKMRCVQERRDCRKHGKGQRRQQ